MGLTAREESELAEKLGAALLAARRLVVKAKMAKPAVADDYKAAVDAETAVSHEIFERLPERTARAVLGKIDAVLQKERPSKWIVSP